MAEFVKLFDIRNDMLLACQERRCLYASYRLILSLKAFQPYAVHGAKTIAL